MIFKVTLFCFDLQLIRTVGLLSAWTTLRFLPTEELINLPIESWSCLAFDKIRKVLLEHTRQSPADGDLESGKPLPVPVRCHPES
jgi:hypothetical protein